MAGAIDYKVGTTDCKFSIDIEILTMGEGKGK